MRENDLSAPDNDPLFGNNISGLLRAALDSSGGIPTPSTGWQPPLPEELQAMLPQYEVSGFLGRGGMGAVYRGRQISLQRLVAIKILPPGLEATDPCYAERFRNEALALAKLRHLSIVAVYDFGQTKDGTYYIAMELIDGTDVAHLVEQQGRLHSATAMAITAHVCDALQYAHERQIIHRDIKPSNIMVGRDGTVKVTDFGLAKILLEGQPGLTRSGMALGTLQYMAPESLTMGTSVDHRADIYAVGVMLYHMLTGHLPRGIFQLPSLHVPGLDPRYDAIIARALRDDRTVRYQTAYEMRRDLDAMLTQPMAQVVDAIAPTVPAQAKAGPPQRVSPSNTSQAARTLLVPKKGGSASMVWLAISICVIFMGAGWWVLRGNPDKRTTPISSTPQVPQDDTNPPSPASIAATAPVTAARTPLDWKARCSQAQRMEHLRLAGGSPEAERSVSAALEQLKQKQNRDGSWGTVDKAGTTALALLAYVGRCETPDSAYFGDTVMKAILFLIETSRRNGEGLFATDPASPRAAGEHGMATYALGQMYLTAQQGAKTLPGMREAFEKGVQVIIKHQLANGGWAGQEGGMGFGTQGSGSIFTTAWQCEALATARQTGLKIDGLNAGITKAGDFMLSLQSAAQSKPSRPPETLEAMMGACMRGLQLTANSGKEEFASALSFSRDHFQKEPPARERADLYSWLFYTRAFFRKGGEDWRLWNRRMLPQLFALQKPDGSWQRPTDFSGGNEHESTALGALILQTYYRDAGEQG